MHFLRSWRALLVREYIEHRIAFFYVPVGILALLSLSAISTLVFRHLPSFEGPLPYSLKLFELGYLVVLALWLAYTAVAVFFFFGDAFSADRRNNAMLFWKSMPVTDIKILTSKFLAGLAMFPALILVVAIVTGLVLFLLINIASFVFPAVGAIQPGAGIASLYEVTLFGIVYYGLFMIWYAPLFAWVGGLSAVFGRWSLPLAFVIPGLIAAIENVTFFGQGPQGGYVWGYLSRRWRFGLDEDGLAQMVSYPGLFHAGPNLARLLGAIDWTQMGIGLVFSALVVLLASAYRRRRIA